MSKGGQKIHLTTCLTTSGAKLNYQKSGISAVGSALALGEYAQPDRLTS